MSDVRIQTGVKGLDEMLFGGVYAASSTAVNGPSGTGKTTLGLQFLVEGMKQEESGLLVSFEQFPEQLYRDALNFGWDLNDYQERGLLKVLFTSPSIFLEELEKERGIIDTFAVGGGRRVFIDPVTYFKYQNGESSFLRKTYNLLVNGLKRNQLTSFLTCETAKFFGDSGEIDEELAFVVDNIILLRYIEIESKVLNAIIVLKSRGSNRMKDIRRYDIGEGGIVTEKAFVGQEGLLTGIPRRSFTEKMSKEFEL